MGFWKTFVVTVAGGVVVGLMLKNFKAEASRLEQAITSREALMRKLQRETESQSRSSKPN